MRALLLLCATAAAATPAPPAPPPTSTLLVLRDACAAARSDVAAQAAFRALADRSANSSLQVLGYDETCGAEWRETVLRRVLAALGAGRGVACGGWPGAAACGALQLAAPQPPPRCSWPEARARAVALLAARLHWRRARLPAPAPQPHTDTECGVTLRSVAAALAALGLAVARGPAAPGDPPPSVEILCSADAEPSPRSRGAALLLLLPPPEDEAAGGPPPPGPLAPADPRGPPALLLADRAPSPPRAPPAPLAVLAAARAPAAPELAALHLCEAAASTWRPVTRLTARLRAPPGAPYWEGAALEEGATKAFAAWCAAHAGAEAGAEADAEAGAPLWPWAAALLGASGAALAGARAWRARRRGRRRRRGAVLAARDFSFPPAERRRVGEGMETMLSCWLQQLHEFGGPELERPDLLKQPPAPPSAPSSAASVSRLAPDTRTRYEGDAVHMRYLPTAAPLELRRKATDVLLVMQGLRHENLNPFIGCMCEMRPALVFDHCGRGSLEDVLMADDITLDWTFRLSLLTDLVKGLRYLHGSPLRVHGRLSSRNCVVDSRWVLRLTDFGLPELARAQALPEAPAPARARLWTAPELLRLGPAARPTQAADVFAFAIVMQEVIVRGEPYCMLQLTPDEIVEKLCRPPPLIRPSVSMAAAPPEAVSVMRQCWAEAAELRPDTHELLDTFRRLHRGRKINIVDSMFEMLEKYSNNLEELIKERTEQLDMEKKKTEQLLNRMLPRSVAERLMLGQRVEPEEFEEVSIYFSDIVGFTALAARSTPVQVVDMLNDLYSTFDAAIEQYRVYKVETIGDAYMVVGGLPVRAADHAESVATMALHLLHLAGRFRVRHMPPGTAPLRLRIGLHSGPCCAAVVGLTMPRYCLFGDTVNTAARMESTGAAWRIQLSAATAARLQAAGGYRLRSRGLTQVKGKGAMHTYWLLGKDGFDKPLPTPPPLDSEDTLVEIDGETDGESTSAPPLAPPASPPAPPAAPPPAPPADADSAPAPDTQRHAAAGRNSSTAWRRSGAVSADSSPPPPGGAGGAARALYRRLAGGARALQRQWSLERGEALGAAAAPPAPPADCEPAPGPAPRTYTRYRTRLDASR